MRVLVAARDGARSGPPSVRDQWVPGHPLMVLSVTRRWLLAHADEIGARRLGKKTIRFSERAMSRYLGRKKGQWVSSNVTGSVGVRAPRLGVKKFLSSG